MCCIKLQMLFSRLSWRAATMKEGPCLMWVVGPPWNSFLRSVLSSHNPHVPLI